MTPPFLARALVAATTPPRDYESVAGDLLEEYAERVAASGRAGADRWYWSQAVRSVPALLSYSRAPRSLRTNVSTGLIVVAVLFAMLLGKDAIDRVIDAVNPQPTGIPVGLYLALDWADAALFGGILAAVVRSGGVRLAFAASFVLVAALGLPSLAGIASALVPLAWVLLLGTVPAMAAGAAAFDVLRRRENGSA